VKRQFVRIQPSTLNGAPKQEALSEEQERGGAGDKPAPTLSPEGFMPPMAQEAKSKSPASYWAREEALPPPENPPYVRPSSPVTQAQGAYPYGPPPVVLQSSPYGPPPVVPQSSPYGAPMYPVASPPMQRPVTGPMVPNNPQGPLYLPYDGPPVQSGMPVRRHSMTDPMLQNNAAFMQQGTPLVRAGKERHNKRRFPIWARVVVVLVAVFLVGGGTAFGYYQANFANPLGKITGQQAAQIGTDGQSTSQAVATGNGIGTKRINILLLGSDNDGKNAAPLAQTDIVVTIDPQTNYVGMLSIPRDLRVVIPDEGTGKMDAAFSFGWQGNFGGATPLSNAAGLSIATVEKNFGIHIDHYAWVGLDGFVKVINTANGVDVDATHPIADNSYPNDVNSTNKFSYQRLYVVPGPQHMDGIQALQYVRTRHADLVGDFGRSARQQQILNQLKTKLDTPSIITKLPELANDLGDTVKTDMSIQDIVNFMGFARNTDTTKIDRLILSPPYSSPATDTSGDFLPNCALIMPKVAQMFNLGNNANCIATASVRSSNTVLAAKQAGSSIKSVSALATTPLANAANLAQQILRPSQPPIQRNPENITGVHRLLDLMFLVVFDSLDATKV
jgi:LCP family protein required for cell wall assembly